MPPILSVLTLIVGIMFASTWSSSFWIPALIIAAMAAAGASLLTAWLIARTLSRAIEKLERSRR